MTNLELIFASLLSNLQQSSCFYLLRAGIAAYDTYPLLFLVVETRSCWVARTSLKSTLSLARLALNPGFPASVFLAAFFDRQLLCLVVDAPRETCVEGTDNKEPGGL